jgi:RsiW-degrading membrane proteinase PrsW (M82 family)
VLVALQILALALPVALYALILRRRGRGAAEPAGGRGLWLVVVTALLGALSFVPAWLAERWVEGWAGLDEHARSSDVAALLYALLVAAPMEQGLKVLAVVPARRSQRFAAPGDGVLYASAVAVGFITAHNAELFSGGGARPIDAARALLAAPAHVFFASTWGFALGRDAARGGPRRIGGRAFEVTWFVAMLFNGLYDHIVFGRSAIALLATAPILLAMAGATAMGLRSLRPRDPLGEKPARFSLAPPSIGAVRAALWRTEQPVMVGWIGIGALVTIGVIAAALVAAVALGHRIGVDFAAVDRADGSASAAPLLLLGGAALAAFPVAGYLVSRASASRGVLEAAIAAALAIGGALVVLGLAAPVAVVFAIAFAPIALALACAGAWLGTGATR